MSDAGSGSLDELGAIRRWIDGRTASTETVTAGNSSLSYDATSNQYVYVWKTDKTWAGKSIRLTVTLADGTSHYARFTFTK